MALTKVTGGTISTTGNYHTNNINSAGVITATKFVGPFEGDVSGIATGANKIKTVDESSDTTCFPLFVNSSTDVYQAAKIGSNLTFNSSAGDLGATKVTAEQFAGNISGTGLTFTTGTFTGNLDVGGTLNYTHVTDVYSVGVATFASNVQVGTGISVVGVSTFTNDIDANSAIVISEDNAIHFRGTSADDADAILRQSAGGGQLLINSRNDTILNIDSNADSTDAHFAVAHGAATGSSTELFRVQEDGKVLIGTTTPAHWSNRSMTIYRNGDNFLELRGSSSNGCGIIFSDGTGNSSAGYPGYIFYSHASNDDSMRFHTGGSGLERVRIEGGGRVNFNPANNDFSNPDIGGSTAGVSINKNTTGQIYAATDAGGSAASNDSTSVVLNLCRRNTSGDGPQLALDRGGWIKASLAGLVGSNTANGGPGQFAIYLHDYNSGSNVRSERLRIDATGRVSVGKHGVGTYNDASEWFKVQSDDSAANISIVSSNDTHSSLNLGDEDDFNIQKIRSDHTNNYLQFFTNDAERLRITPGAAEQATLVIDHIGTNGATFIADNYTANGTEHTWSIGNMYSGGGFFAGYAMKPKGDGWGFVSSTDAYADRRACLTLNGSGYDAFRIDATDASQQITTNSDVTTVNVFAIEHSGNVKLGSNNPILKIDTGNASAGSNLRIEIDGTEEFRIDPGSIEYKNSNNATRGVLLAPNNYYSNTNAYIDLTQWRLSDSWHILEVFGTVNPNSSGSGAYVDPCHFYIYRGVGWDSGVKHWIYCASVAPPARHAFPSGTGYAGNAGISAVWYDGSNIVGNKSATSTHYVRLLIPNANAGANFQKNFRVMRRF